MAGTSLKPGGHRAGPGSPNWGPGKPRGSTGRVRAFPDMYLPRFGDNCVQGRFNAGLGLWFAAVRERATVLSGPGGAGMRHAGTGWFPEGGRSGSHDRRADLGTLPGHLAASRSAAPALGQKSWSRGCVGPAAEKERLAVLSGMPFLLRPALRTGRSKESFSWPFGALGVTGPCAGDQGARAGQLPVFKGVGRAHGGSSTSRQGRLRPVAAGPTVGAGVEVRPVKTAMGRRPIGQVSSCST